MVHERDDKYDGQEDGEYHFSDDQGSYDVEPEIAPKTAAAAPVKGPVTAASLKVSFNQYRKPIIGVGVFLLLIFLVYKISAPTTTQQPATDFAQNSGTIPAKNPAMKQLPKTIKTAQATDNGFQPLPQAAGMSNDSSTGRPAAPEAVLSTTPEATTTASTMPQPGMPVTTTTTTTVATTTPVSTPETPVMVGSIPAPGPGAILNGNGVPNPAAPAPAESYYNPSHPSSVVVAGEAENAKLIAEYSQKLAAAEAQNTALQNKVDDLTMRLASMETTLTHLSKSIQDIKPTNAGGNRGNEVAAAPIEQAASNEPKSTYSVQAIIPGRAWLKSDGGETVTVAEGDILKNYGRIVKIDPYDGVVQIDTGSHLMSLAYGVSAE